MERGNDNVLVFHSQATRYTDFFPSLNTLQIHLENHSATDLPERCDEHFCKRIEALWLNTKDILGNQEGEIGAYMTSFFAKFENLESLHLNLSSGFLTTEHLF